MPAPPGSRQLRALQALRSSGLPRLPAPQPLRFGCTCSRERTRNALLSLGAAEIRQLLDEDGEATLTCDFCLSREHFDAVDLAELAREAEAR